MSKRMIESTGVFYKLQGDGIDVEYHHHARYINSTMNAKKIF